MTKMLKNSQNYNQKSLFDHMGNIKTEILFKDKNRNLKISDLRFLFQSGRAELNKIGLYRRLPRLAPYLR